MKIALWQQFSSNHSSYFTVVGEFASPQEAQATAEQILQFFKSINEWFEQPENAAQHETKFEEGYAEVSEPEKQISQRYGIPWYEQTIDWLYPQVTKAVVVVDRLLFIEPGQTWQGGRPLAGLVAALGGKGMIAGDVDDFEIGGENRTVSIRITCETSSSEAAAVLVNAIVTYQDTSNDILRNQKNDQLNLLFNPPWKAHEIVPQSSAFFHGVVRQNGTQIVMEHVDFHHLGHGFPALISWLEAQGCIKFEYQLEEIIEDDE
jgi:hypothetical protein